MSTRRKAVRPALAVKCTAEIAHKANIHIEVPKATDVRREIRDLMIQNIYSDAILQSIGLIILGEAIRRHPELNDPGLYLAELDLDDPDVNPSMRINSASLECMPISRLLDDIEDMINRTAAELRRVLNAYDAIHCPHRMVAGTLRIHVDLGLDGSALAVTLLWCEQKPCVGSDHAQPAQSGTFDEQEFIKRIRDQVQSAPAPVHPPVVKKEDCNPGIPADFDEKAFIAKMKIVEKENEERDRKRWMR